MWLVMEPRLVLTSGAVVDDGAVGFTWVVPAFYLLLHSPVKILSRPWAALCVLGGTVKLTLGNI